SRFASCRRCIPWSQVPNDCAPESPCLNLPFRRATHQFLHLALCGTARVLARFKRLLGGFLFARGEFYFLSICFAEFFRICHETFPGVFNLVICHLVI